MTAAAFVATMHQPTQVATTTTPLTTTEAVVLLATLAFVVVAGACLVLAAMREHDRRIDEIFNREP
jgi:hypothetical protein